MADAQVLSMKVNHVVKGVPYDGVIKMTGIGLAFKENNGGKAPIVINKPELASGRWMRVGRGNQMRIKLKTGNALTFDDFTNQNKLEVTEFFQKEFEIELESVDVNVGGWNWGRLEIDGQMLAFSVEGNTAFEIPMNAVINAQSASKHEASVEFNVDRDDRQGQQLESMRFHFTAHSDDEEEAGGKRQAEVWVNKIMEKADVLKTTGLSIAKMPQIMCMAPRARYDFDFHQTFFHMRSGAADYKIKYEQVKQMFKLTQPDRPSEYFVVELDPPLKHNLKRHDIVTFSLNQSTEVTVEINRTEDEDVQQKLTKADVLDEETGPVCDILARLLKAMSQKKLYGPSKTYKSKHGNEGLKCNIKNTIDGVLYPLEKAFLFVYKNPVYIRYDAIRMVEFEQMNRDTHSTVRAFTLNINRKDGESTSFSNIQKVEYQALKNYLEQKKIEITSDEGTGSARSYNEGSDDDDAYAQMAKAEGRAVAGEDGGSSEDESFHGSEMEESDIDEEFDSDGGSSAGGSDSDGSNDGLAGEDRVGGMPVDELRKKKKKKKREKGEKQEGAPKEPKAPKMVKKKTASAYMLYSASIRETIKKDNPEIKSTEIMQTIGKKWNALSEEEKTPFNEQAAQLKADAPMIEHVAKKAAEDDPAAPKKPRQPKSAYLLFSGSASVRADLKTANPDIEAKELMTALGAKWSTMSDADKQPFVDEAAPDKARYLEEMKVYKEALGTHKRKKSGKAKKPDNGRPKQPQSAFLLFSGEKRAGLKEANPEAGLGDIAKLIGKAWGEVSEENKAPYHEQAAKLKEKYKEDVDAWRQKRIAEGHESDEEPAKKKTKSNSSAKQSLLNFKSAEMVNSDDDVSD